MLSHLVVEPFRTTTPLAEERGASCRFDTDEASALAQG
jgi:hypothetical protein